MDSVQIKTFNSVPLELEKDSKALDALCFHLEDHTPEQMQEIYDKYGSEENRFKYIFAFEGNVLVGQIILLKRSIHFNGKEILLGGIGGVCTHPDFQRKGIATKMLDVAKEELKKENCNIAYLCTDITKLGNLYGQVGFVPLNRNYKFIGKSGKEYVKSDAMIAPINSREIFEEVLNSKELFDLEGQAW